MLTNSWIIRDKETKAVIMETFDRQKVNALNTNKYEALTTLEYLVELNQSIKKD